MPQDFAATSLIKACVPPLSNKENLPILSVRDKEWLQYPVLHATHEQAEFHNTSRCNTHCYLKISGSSFFLHEAVIALTAKIKGLVVASAFYS